MSASASPIPELGWGKTVLYSLVPLACLLGVLEISARVLEVFYPPMSVEAGLTFTPESRVFVPMDTHPGLMLTNPAKSGVPDQVSALLPSDVPASTAAPFRIQWFPEKKPKGVYRIAIVGESSIFNAHYQLLRMGERLWFRFAGVNEVEVLNCGGSGYGSDRLVILVREIMAYDPDLVLLYIGNNEFNEMQQIINANLNLLPVQRMLWKSAFLRFVRDRMALYALVQKVEEHNQKLLGEPLQGRPAEVSDIEPETIDARMQNFYSNLSLMVDICREHGVNVLMGTIPSNLRRPYLLPPDKERFEQEVEPLYAAGDFATARKATMDILERTLRSQSSDQENDINRRVAAEKSVPLIDMEKIITDMEPNGIPGETMFLDHCHLTHDGMNVMAQSFEDAIAERMKLQGFDESWRVAPEHAPAYEPEATNRVAAN